MGQIDLVSISKNKSFVQRCQNLSGDFAFQFATFDNADAFFSDNENTATIRCFILDCTEFSNIHEAAGTIQVARQMMDRSYIICILNSRVTPEEMDLLKKSGANLIMLDNEFTTNSKLEFVSSQVIKSAYIPLKVIDLVPDSIIDASLYMLMPKNGKFLKISKPGVKVSADFIKKYSEAQELFIHRSDLEAWVAYVEKFQSKDDNSEARACRANFLKLQQAFLELVLLISDQTTSTSFSSGKELFANCEGFCHDLLSSLSHVQYPWEVINNSSIGDFGSVERGTAVAAYAGMLSHVALPEMAPKIMIGALLSDIGLILVSPSVTKKIRSGPTMTFEGEELMEYEKHPIFGLNQILSKRIPLDDKTKDIILMSHERLDQKGFPNRPGPVKIKEESMIARLAQELDQALTVRMGAERIQFKEVFEAFIANKITNLDGYSLTLLLKLKPLFEGKIHTETLVEDKGKKLYGFR